MNIRSLVVVLCAAATLLSGCCVSIPAGPQRSDVPVALRATSYVSVTEGYAERTGEGLLVRGTLRRTGPVHLPGHVDVSIVGPDGISRAARQIAVPGLSSRRRGITEIPFSASVDGELPPGASLLLRYHAPPFTEEPG